MSPSTAFSILLCLIATATDAIDCPDLGSAVKFTVVASNGVTNTGLSVIEGNVAVYPIASVTGFPPGVITGNTELATTVAAQVQTDETSAYNYCKSLPYTADLTGIDLAGQTLAPGVYKFGSTAEISAAGVLTLKGVGIYIFQVGSAITTGINARIVVEDGAKAGCIFWQVGSSVTHGATSTFLGNILAYESVIFGSGVTYEGSVYSQTGAVTLVDDAITHQLEDNVCQSCSKTFGD